MTNISEFRGKTRDELKDKVLELKKELFNLRFQVASGEMQNTSRFRTVRRDIARIKTAMDEPEGGIVQKVKKAKVAKPAKVAKTAEAKTAEPKAPKETKAKKTATKKKSGE